MRDVTISWNTDIKSTSLSTNSAAGSYKEVDVWFYDQDCHYAGGMRIRFYTQIQFYLGGHTEHHCNYRQYSRE